MTKQVLAFARPANDEARLVDLNDAVGEFDKMLGRAGGEHTTLALELAPEPLPAWLDVGQLELVVLNLVRNAGDAMDGTGSIVVRTAGHPADAQGDQPTVEVSVSDTGPGMSPAVVDRATEAFFTTKDPGHGTGMGLWMVQQFASANGGKLAIESSPGRGTTVRLVFPRAEETAQ